MAVAPDHENPALIALVQLREPTYSRTKGPSETPFQCTLTKFAHFDYRALHSPKPNKYHATFLIVVI